MWFGVVFIMPDLRAGGSMKLRAAPAAARNCVLDAALGTDFWERVVVGKARLRVPGAWGREG